MYNGDGYKFDKRELKLSTNAFLLPVNPDETITFYVSIESDGDLVSLPISIVSDDYLISMTNENNLFIGLFYGFLMLIVVINLFYFINLKDKVYFYYILYVIVLGIYAAARDGLTFQFLWKNAPYWNNIAVSIFSSLTMVFILKVIQYTLNTKLNFPKLHKIITYFTLVILALLVPLFMPKYYAFYINFGNILASVAIVLGIYTIIVSIRKRLFFAKYFLLALAFLIVGTLMVVLKNNGLPGIFQFEFWFKLFVTAEIIILSYGLTVLFNNLLQESKQQAIDRLEQINYMKEQVNMELEIKVIERTKELDKQNKELEILFNEVVQQNIQINEQTEELKTINNQLIDRNNEINQQKEEIRAQKEEIEKHRDLLFEQKQKVTQSIEYAKKIQKAVFPGRSILNEFFSDFFIYFKSRDIVSGDFYWFKKNENKLFFAIADCTGHGVPGAFISMLGIALMNELSFGFLNFSPAEVLTKLREMIIGVLHQTNEKFERSDGIDMALCFFDREKSVLSYSGANIPAFVCTTDNNETVFKILKPNKIPVGVYPIRKNFTNENIQLQKNDVIYVCSDGYQDQFGGEHNEKFMSKRLKQLFIDCHKDTMINQYNILDINLKKWMNADTENNSKPQIDDILILGLKV